MKKLSVAVTLFMLVASAQAQTKKNKMETSYLLIGTYTSDKSEGIYVHSFNHTTGEAKAISSFKTDNPSFLAIAPGEKYVYAANENGSGINPPRVSAFSFDKKEGCLTLLNTTSSGGNNPCHVTVDNTGQWVTAANYSGGSLAVFPVRKDGSLDSFKTKIQHSGKGPNPARQAGPHVHATVFSPDEQYLLVPDLGIDQVITYQFDKKDGSLVQHSTARLKDGAGPRHLDFHPSGNFVYLAEELGGSVTAFKYNSGHLTAIQTISSHPADFEGTFGSADIHCSKDGRYLYISNRNSANSITIFSINPSSGMLTQVGYQPVLGKTPRNFSIDPSGNFLLVANQNSNEIVVFKRDQQTGLLTDTGKRIAVDKPVCLKWISR